MGRATGQGLRQGQASRSMELAGALPASLPTGPGQTHHSHPHFSGWETEVLPQSRAWGPWLEVCQSHPPLEPEVTASNPMASCSY